MGIVRIARADFQPLEEAFAEEDIAAQVGAVLAQANADLLFAMLFLALLVFVVILFLMVFFLAMMMPRTRPAGNLIGSVVNAEGDTQIAIALEEGETRIGSPGFGRAIGQHAALVGGLAQFLGLFELALVLFFGGLCKDLGAQRRRHREPGNLEIVAFAP